MTENQEKELFNTLATLVTGVWTIQSDVQDIKVTQNEHSRILNEHSGTLNEHSRTLNEHSRTLNEHSQILNEHSRILNEHSRILNRLDSKTDSIAETIMTNDKRLTAVEKDVANIRSGIN